jgi:hypothetical protein
MADFKNYWSFKSYERYPSCYAKLNRTLNAIWAQNEEIKAKLREIEDFLYKKFADTLAKNVLKEGGSGS